MSIVYHSKNFTYTTDDIPDAEKLADILLITQSACNASGLLHHLDKVMGLLWDLAGKKKQGTDWVNQHPVLTLYLGQLNYLNSFNDERHSKALELIESLKKEGQKMDEREAYHQSEYRTLDTCDLHAWSTDIMEW